MADLRRAADFYRDALGFDTASRASTSPHAARLHLGTAWIELVEVAPASMPLPAFAPDPRFQHAAIVTDRMDAAWQRLMAFGTTPITLGGPQRLPAASGGLTAFKFRDPDGHPVELIDFAAGKGDPRWNRPSTGITLGIDHFALAVSRMATSLVFYRSLGFEVMGRQVNQGPEQGRLDGLSAPVVEVVTLRPADGSGPHLELLCYRRPVWRADDAMRPKGGDELCGMFSGMDTGAAEVSDPDGHLISALPTC